MNKHRSRPHDDLVVLVSLAVALGMVLGAVAATWFWSVAWERRGAVVLMKTVK